jgi:hypothetical protein
MKLVGLIEMCLNEAYNKVGMGKHLLDKIPIENDLKQGDGSPLLFNFVFEYATKNLQEHQVGVKLNGTLQLLAYDDDANLLGDYIDTINKNTENLFDESKEVGLEVNIEENVGVP